MLGLQVLHQVLCRPVPFVQAGGTISRKSWFLWQSTELPKRSRIQVYAASRTCTSGIHKGTPTYSWFCRSSGARGVNSGRIFVEEPTRSHRL